MSYDNGSPAAPDELAASWPRSAADYTVLLVDEPAPHVRRLTLNRPEKRNALNHALRDIDPAKVRVHICWGNYEGPHVCDIDMDKVFPTLMRTRARYVLFETSNPRHAHEWTVFRDRASEIPDDKVLVPGVVDTTTNFVEHPELVAQRIARFVDIVGADRVIAGSDCGFGTFAGFGAVDPDIAYAKLATLAEGAALASGRL